MCSFLSVLPIVLIFGSAMSCGSSGSGDVDGGPADGPTRDSAVHDATPSDAATLVDAASSPDSCVPMPSYADSDLDGYGDPIMEVVACMPPTGYVTDNSDCNDSLIGVNPGAVELCNGIDDNCDSLTDNGAECPNGSFCDGANGCVANP